MSGVYLKTHTLFPGHTYTPVRCIAEKCISCSPSWTSFYITMYNNTDDVCVSSCRLTWINTMASTASVVTLMTACSRQGLHTVSPHTLKENICAHIRIRSFIVVSALSVRNTKIDYRIIWTQNISR